MNDASGQRCGNCRWWLPQLGRLNKPHYKRAGRCGYVVIWPTLPQYKSFVETSTTLGIWHDDGKDCPTWQAK